MLLGDPDGLAARHSYVPVWDWIEDEEWQCMRHRSSSLEDSLRTVLIPWIRRWATRGRQEDWVQS